MTTRDSGIPSPDEDLERAQEMSARGLRKAFERHLRRTLARDRYSASDRDRYHALALAVRDQLVERSIATQQLRIFSPEQVEESRPHYNRWDIYNSDEEIGLAIELIDRDSFSMMEQRIFKPIVHSLLDGGDRLCCLRI